MAGIYFKKIVDIIQKLFDGSFKYGAWWLDCNDFHIEKVIVFSSNYKRGYNYEEIPEKKAKKNQMDA